MPVTPTSAREIVAAALRRWPVLMRRCRLRNIAGRPWRPPRGDKTAARAATGLAARHAIRAGAHTGPTSGLAPGYVQGNLAILPEALAADFLRFCQLNPKPCPLLGVVGAGRLARCRRSATTSTSAPTSRATACGATANWSTSRPISRALARRSRQLRARLLVLVRGSADRGRHRDPPHHPQLHRADVSHHDRDRGGRSVPRPDGRVDAADEAGRRDPRGADHHALSGRARRAGAYRQAGD